jgi:hypothetical protein
MDQQLQRAYMSKDGTGSKSGAWDETNAALPACCRLFLGPARGK